VELNLLDLVPVRNREWEELEDRQIIILQPKIRNPWLARWLLPRMKRPHYRVKLDTFGSWVWNRCDGRKTVKEIGLSLKEHFGETVEPVYDRLGIFLNQLEQSEFIQFVNSNDHSEVQ